VRRSRGSATCQAMTKAGLPCESRANASGRCPVHARLAELPSQAEDRAFLAGVLEEAWARLERGRDTYGRFVPETDRRDLKREAEEEFLDAIVYAALGIYALRRAARG